MEKLIFILLGLLLLVEILGATTALPTVSEAVDKLLAGKPGWIRASLLVAWLGLGVHLFYGWLK